MPALHREQFRRVPYRLTEASDQLLCSAGASRHREPHGKDRLVEPARERGRDRARAVRTLLIARGDSLLPDALDLPGKRRPCFRLAVRQTEIREQAAKLAVE